MGDLERACRTKLAPLIVPSERNSARESPLPPTRMLAPVSKERQYSSSSLSKRQDSMLSSTDSWKFEEETLWRASSLGVKGALKSFDDFRRHAQMVQRRGATPRFSATRSLAKKSRVSSLSSNRLKPLNLIFKRRITPLFKYINIFGYGVLRVVRALCDRKVSASSKADMSAAEEFEPLGA